MERFIAERLVEPRRRGAINRNACRPSQHRVHRLTIANPRERPAAERLATTIAAGRLHLVVLQAFQEHWGSVVDDQLGLHRASGTALTQPSTGSRVINLKRVGGWSKPLIRTAALHAVR
ncbi:hypothetical protein K491DRAFT_680584 [Lophiostoma macrostomum CBS 122681]|uniref:Uncharacterized protein n=1 Tax=Lophiostoma macrostomum CBS 122681 TaxID=1314788 RepID=A0A6A6T2M5_9PLEO|nr:hypothetical protein K491DRAFT_680584 [Lophiostoma macrostomum CBS 122681]